MTIAIDFDGTLKGSSQIDPNECRMWGTIIRAFQDQGHEVIICTMRCGSAEDRQELSRYLGLLDIPDLAVVYCSQALKHQTCIDAGILVDIWIDDMPETIRGR